jgi:sortase (surface protein transpeptidase)
VNRRQGAAIVAGLVLFVAWLHGYVDFGAGAAPRGTPARSDRPAHVYGAHVPLSTARPLRVDIPSIGVHAPIVARGLDSAGGVDPPPYTTPEVAGWWGAGPAPGAKGAALLVGHVDTPTRPAVFYGLSSVVRGALVEVTRSDGTVAEFTVEGVEVVDKAGFRADRVYGSDGRPELRLITCGGTFDRVKREYSANVVVFAALTGTRLA